MSVSSATCRSEDLAGVRAGCGAGRSVLSCGPSPAAPASRTEGAQGVANLTPPSHTEDAALVQPQPWPLPFVVCAPGAQPPPHGPSESHPVFHTEDKCGFFWEEGLSVYQKEKWVFTVERPFFLHWGRGEVARPSPLFSPRIPWGPWWSVVNRCQPR